LKQELETKPYVFSPSEAARYMSLSRSMVYKLIREGKLPIVRIGGVIRIRVQDIEAFFDNAVAEWQ
jgi:excisionase family DNA binding protein